MILIVAGVAGSGKTTLGELVASKLNWEFADGDAFHSATNVAKMRSGTPLNDSDRWPWLEAIGAWMDERIAVGRSAVVACSALARRYRQALLASRPQATMVFLEISREQASTRCHVRHGHFFGAAMVASQFAELEPPQPDEPRVLVLYSTRPPEELADTVIAELGLAEAPPAGGQESSGHA
jgi:gluconokinase